MKKTKQSQPQCVGNVLSASKAQHQAFLSQDLQACDMYQLIIAVKQVSQKKKQICSKVLHLWKIQSLQTNIILRLF